MDPRIVNALCRAHSALRMVDASDQTQPQTDRTLDAVSAAVDEIEATARWHGIVLPEFAMLCARAGKSGEAE